MGSVNPQSVANRSFLHANRKSIVSNKLLYATLDSLALRRTRLPLRLLPNLQDESIERIDKSIVDTKLSNEEIDAVNPKVDDRRENDRSECNDVSSELRESCRRTKQEDNDICENDSKIETSNNNEASTIKENLTPADASNNKSQKEEEIEGSDKEMTVSDATVNSRPLDDSEETKTLTDETLESDKIIVKKSADLIEDESEDRTEREKVSKKSKSTNCLVSENFPTTNEKTSGEMRKREKRVSKGNYEFLSSDEDKDAKDIVIRKKKHFDVFNYVPVHLRKRSKNSSFKIKKINNSLSASLISLKTVSKESALKEESRNIAISSPTNFVHVASATTTKLGGADENNGGNSEENPLVFTHEEKVAVLPLLIEQEDEISRINTIYGPLLRREEHRSNLPNDETAYVEIQRKSEQDVQPKLEKVPLETCQKEKTHFESKRAPRLNFSFLWTNRPRNSPSNGVTEQDYDDVGLSNSLIQECDYDDVGPPEKSAPSPSNDENLRCTSTNVEEIYDDVMLSYTSQESTTGIKEEKESRETDKEIDKEIDSVEYRRSSESRGLDERRNWAGDNENQYLSINNDYSSVDGETPEDDVYDDVCLPSEERVNSLYSSYPPVPNARLTSTNGKETECERQEDSMDVVSASSCNKHLESQSCREKQIGGKNKFVKKKKKKKKKKQRPEGPAEDSIQNSEEAKAESMMYDGCSDDSNYETLYSTQDDFSTDSEAETNHVDEETGSHVTNIFLEAPSKPTPPPPREGSLTQTLGRKIKMLRRTWSITKGNLGRMRRKAIMDEDLNSENGKTCSNDHHIIDNTKYFSFRKHFRKNTSTLSTFYLNDSINDECTSARNNNNNSSSKELIYRNTEYNGINTVTNFDKDVQSTCTNDHYSVLADQEPLYQFYAAAVARSAFDSDSDGYEEVDVTNLPATDLVKPGHRTLWCQTPQVIHSGLLQNLSMEERKIQEAKFEILTSEASYLNSLRVLQNEFINDHELSEETLTPFEKDQLFGGVHGVLRISEKFLSELETLWRCDPILKDLPNVLLRYAEISSDVYVSYCSNQVSIDTTLKELRNRKGGKFSEIVSRLEMRPACRNLSLHSFLMLPMQRVTRLPLLADAVLSKLLIEHPDRLSWEQVLSNLSYIVAECNEGARTAAQEAEMEALARKLEYPAKMKPIVLRGRHLIRSGPLVQLSMKSDTEYKLTFGKRFSKTSVNLFLLTDYVLVTKPKSNTQEETYSVMDTCKRSFVTLEPVSEESPFNGRNAMILTLLENYCGRQAEYVLMCDNDTERERWFEAVSPPNSGLVGETLYETWDCPQVMALYSYSPNQPDELSLQPGDVINVLRKMADGWHHGEKLLDGQQGWFPGNYTKEVASEHVRARNLKQRHRLLAITGSILQRRAKTTPYNKEK